MSNNHHDSCGKDNPDINLCTCHAVPEPGTRRWSPAFNCYITLVEWQDDMHFTYRLEDDKSYAPLPNQNSWWKLAVHDPKKFKK